MLIPLLGSLVLSIFSTAAAPPAAAASLHPAPSAEERMKQLSSLGAVLSGPNCWNAATFVAGINPYVLLTTELQASLLFRGSCRPVSGGPDDAPAGSVVRISADGEEVHAFYALGNRQFFQKRDNSSLGRYEIVPFAEIEKLYGKDRYCQSGQPCGWATQNLACVSGKSFRDLKAMPKTFATALALASSMATNPRNLRASSNAFSDALVELSGEQAAVAAYLKSADANSAALLFDLAQTVRLLGADLPSRLGPEEAKRLRKNFDASVWPLAEAYANRRNLGKAEISILYDFAYGAHGCGAKPERLREKIVALMKPFLGDSALRAARLRLFGNPHFPYGDAGDFIFRSLTKAERGDSDALSAVAFFLNHSASPLSKRDEIIERTIMSEHPMDDDTILNLVESLSTAGFDRSQKISLYRRIEIKAAKTEQAPLAEKIRAALAALE